MTKLKMHTPDLVGENIDQIAELFPNCVTEVKDGKSGQIKRAIDFDQLRQELSDHIVEGPRERYQLDWPGKRESLLAANAPIAKTLRPAREESAHFDTTKNLFIEGDNLDALKLLQETYLGKVKMIYIDPPYNTGNDFIYDDDFAEDAEEYFERSKQRDAAGARLIANPDSNGRFHSDWLSMIYSRLKLARNLLREDGVIFISIDDNEQSNLRKVCDEVFGERNFAGVFVVKSTPNARNYGHIARMHDYCLMYAKSQDLTRTYEEVVEEKTFKYQDGRGGFNIHPLYNSDESFHSKNRPNLYYPLYLSPKDRLDKDFYKISLSRQSPDDIEVFPPLSSKNKVQFVWRWSKDKAGENLNTEIVGYKTDQNEYRVVRKMRHTTQIIRSMFLDPEYSGRRGTAEAESLLGGKIFSFPKPLALISKLLEVATSDDDIVLDFFAGSCTTAHAVMNQNLKDGRTRRFIVVQAPELCDSQSVAFQAGYHSISDIGKERIRRAANQLLTERGAKESSGMPLFERTLQAEAGDCSPDIGFRVLKIDTSNMKDVYYSPDMIKQDDLLSHIDNIKEDRTPEDLLFQVLVDWGVDLGLPIEQQKIDGQIVFFVATNALAACFEERIDEDLVKQIAKRKPVRALFRDASFDSDSTKLNVEQIFKLLSPETEVRTL